MRQSPIHPLCGPVSKNTLDLTAICSRFERARIILILDDAATTHRQITFPKHGSHFMVSTGTYQPLPQVPCFPLPS